MSASGSSPHGKPSHGTPRDELRAMERRMRNSAKKRVEQAELALHHYRARAAAILHAEGLHSHGEEPHSTYVFKILRHRETGVRVRVLDTQAADAPTTTGDGAPRQDVVHQYLVECQTHGTRGPSFASSRSALAAARRSHEWCDACAELGGSERTKPRSRGGAGANGGGTNGRHVRRRDDVWP